MVLVRGMRGSVEGGGVVDVLLTSSDKHVCHT